MQFICLLTLVDLTCKFPLYNTKTIDVTLAISLKWNKKSTLIHIKDFHVKILSITGFFFNNFFIRFIAQKKMKTLISTNVSMFCQILHKLYLWFWPENISYSFQRDFKSDFLSILNFIILPSFNENQFK